MATSKELVGRKIVGYNPRLFRAGSFGYRAKQWAHDPELILDNGWILRFHVEETDCGFYGVGICIDKRGANNKRVEAQNAKS